MKRLCHYYQEMMKATEQAMSKKRLSRRQSGYYMGPEEWKSGGLQFQFETFDET